MIAILTISYLYGMWRLHQLKGPGVDEFIEGKEAPFRGKQEVFERKGIIMNCLKLALNKIKKNPFGGFFIYNIRFNVEISLF